MIRTGSLIRTYTNGGVSLGDICDEITGAPHIGCPFLGGGQGTDEDFGQDTPAQGARVLYIMYRGASDQAIILGCLPQPSTGTRLTTQPRVSAEWDYPVNRRDVLDWVRQKNGAVLAVTNDGHIVMDTTGSGKVIRVQLPAGTPLRISQGGETPTEKVPLMGPLLETLNSLIDRVNTLQESVAQLATVTALLSNPAIAATMSGPLQAIVESLKTVRAAEIQAVAQVDNLDKLSAVKALVAEDAAAKLAEAQALQDAATQKAQQAAAFSQAISDQQALSEKLAKQAEDAPTQQAKDDLAMQQAECTYRIKELTAQAEEADKQATAQIAGLQEAAAARAQAYSGKITALQQEATKILEDAAKQVLSITTGEGAVEAFKDIVYPPLPMAPAGEELASGAILISSQPAASSALG